MKSVVDPVVWRSLLPGQVSRLCAIDVLSGQVSVLFESDSMVIEAPNWSPDGSTIVVNSAGCLYRYRIGVSDELEPIDTPGIDDHNNDHLISPDGQTIYTSSEGTGHLFSVPIAGGRSTRISNDREGTFSYFLQGVSADGSTLGYVGATGSNGPTLSSELFTIPSGGGANLRHTDWGTASVGVEFSPDGQWWYLNAELDSDLPGHAQVYRVRPDGSGLEKLTDDKYVNWFPKPSPDGQRLAYLSFPPGTVGHEANVPVVLRLMNADGSGKRTLLEFFGGQGTLNVNSWAPDSRQLAFMAYPVLAHD